MISVFPVAITNVRSNILAGTILARNHMPITTKVDNTESIAVQFSPFQENIYDQ